MQRNSKFVMQKKNGKEWLCNYLRHVTGDQYRLLHVNKARKLLECCAGIAGCLCSACLGQHIRKVALSHLTQFNANL
eukprot:XP_001704782.1 Hypothetical protein GL50803_92900 [Giardia lamblia ATCC 50803]